MQAALSVFVLGQFLWLLVAGCWWLVAGDWCCVAFVPVARTGLADSLAG